jgi:hypothetical protein
MISEDYVSFETAKLLKEKGFDEPCYQYYLTTKTLHTTFHDRMHVEEEPFFNSSELNGLYEVADKTLFEDICSAPTLQMAMKWLREVHNLCIEPYRTAYGYLYIISRVPTGSDLYSDGDDYDGDDEASGQWTTYEKACEAAIKYCLENLI